MIDSLFGPDIPDPLELVEQSIVQPFMDTGHEPDPLAELLTGLEASIEQAVPPEMEMFTDPLCNDLDSVEASIEGIQFDRKPFSPDEMLDKLETSIEKAPEKKTVASDEEQLVVEDAVIRHGEMNRLPVMDISGKTFTAWRPEPVHRMHGTRTGICNSGSVSALYCHLHQSWIQASDCLNCHDYDPVGIRVDEQMESCRHSSQYQDDV